MMQSKDYVDEAASLKYLYENAARIGRDLGPNESETRICLETSLSKEWSKFR